MNNLELIKSINTCVHLIELKIEDEWYRLLDIDSGLILGVNTVTDEFAISTAKEDYREINDNEVKKIILTNKSKSCVFEQAYKKSYPL